MRYDPLTPSGSPTDSGDGITVDLLTPGLISHAQGFGSSAIPVHYVLGDNTIYWTSLEGNQTHHNYFYNFWLWVTEAEYQYLSSIDAQENSAWYNMYWFVTPLEASSDTLCMSYADPTQNPPTCALVRVRHREQGIESWTDAGRAQAVCHEIGHGVGFVDYAHGNVGCMGGGSSNSGHLDIAEVAHLNACYVTVNWQC